MLLENNQIVVRLLGLDDSVALTVGRSILFEFNEARKTLKVFKLGSAGMELLIPSIGEKSEGVLYELPPIGQVKVFHSKKGAGVSFYQVPSNMRLGGEYFRSGSGQYLLTKDMHLFRLNDNLPNKLNPPILRCTPTPEEVPQFRSKGDLLAILEEYGVRKASLPNFHFVPQEGSDMIRIRFKFPAGKGLRTHTNGEILHRFGHSEMREGQSFVVSNATFACTHRTSQYNLSGILICVILEGYPLQDFKNFLDCLLGKQRTKTPSVPTTNPQAVAA